MPRKAMSKQQWHDLIDAEAARCKHFSGKVQVNVSGGCASSVVWKRCVEWYGMDSVVPVFADTSYEHADLYRFLDDCEKHIGQPLERLKDGRDIWDVFDQAGIMRITSAGGACKASVELKQYPLAKHLEESGCDAIAVGIEFLEPERISAFQDRVPGREVLFPLTVRPLLSECEIIEEVRSWGVKPPTIYDDGYTHNNCGGFCILAGLGQWAANRKRDPQAFEYAAKRERQFTKETGFTVLRDQSGGEVRPYTLDELARDQDSGREFPKDWKSNCNCMVPLFRADDCF